MTKVAWRMQTISNRMRHTADTSAHVTYRSGYPSCRCRRRDC